MKLKKQQQQQKKQYLLGARLEVNKETKREAAS